MSSSECELPALRRSPPRRRITGKRSRDSDSGNSSDAVFFSSDDLADASAEKYVSPARRTQYRRAWYEPEEPSRVHSHEAMRTATKRPKDSGIYMNSDDSSSSADDGFAVDSIKLVAAQRASKKMAAFMDSSSPSQPTDESFVRTAVADCLENGKEMLDLSGQDLVTVRDEDLQPLRNHVRHPRFDPSAFTEETLEALIPCLQIFLSRNNLRRVPSEIFNLPSLTCLSLRNNLLCEIPPAIGYMANLQELNVASNQLRWLPWELVSLLASGSLHKLHERPNPFLPCTIAAETLQAYYREDAVPESFQNPARVLYLGATAAAFFEHDGGVSPWSPAPPSVFMGESLPTCSEPFRKLQRRQAVATPSLFETALRSCAKNPLLDIFQNYLPIDTPDHLRRALAMTQQVTLEGGTRCSVCSSQYVIARAEWIEFWQCFVKLTYPMSRNEMWTNDNTIPFLRRACSWRCALSAKLGSPSPARHGYEVMT